MKIRTIGQAAGSVRNFPSRIYNGEQLEACRQLGPEIRRVGTRPWHAILSATYGSSRTEYLFNRLVQLLHVHSYGKSQCTCHISARLKPGDRSASYPISHADGREIPVDNAWLQAIAAH